MKTIEVEIDIQTGNAKVSVAGVSGKSCMKETEQIEAALGKVKEVRKTSEYAKAEETKNRASQQG